MGTVAGVAICSGGAQIYTKEISDENVGLLIEPSRVLRLNAIPAVFYRRSRFLAVWQDVHFHRDFPCRTRMILLEGYSFMSIQSAYHSARLLSQTFE